MAENLLSVDPRQVEWEAEITQYPPPVREVMRRFPNYLCYRSKEDPEFHYVIHTYSRDRRTDEVRLTLVHAHGTCNAGSVTYGQRWQQLIRCDCGKWEPPTEEDAIRLRELHGRHDCGHSHSPWDPRR